MTADLNIIVERFKKEAETDYIGLWEIIRAIKSVGKVTAEVELRDHALLVVRAMLATGFIVGFPTSKRPGFHPWEDQNLAYVLQRIDNEWKALGREPNIGDIVWFDLPVVPKTHRG